MPSAGSNCDELTSADGGKEGGDADDFNTLDQLLGIYCFRPQSGFAGDQAHVQLAASVAQCLNSGNPASLDPAVAVTVR